MVFSRHLHSERGDDKLSQYSDLLPHDQGNDASGLSYALRGLLRGLCHTMVVQVIAVDTDKMTVDVLPLVSGIRADGTKISNNPITGLPYFRLQAGVRAIILDPSAGDIGIVVVSDKDITNVKANKTESVPGSQRLSNPKDGIYLGGIASLCSTPTEYIKLTGSGIKIVGDVSITGTLTTSSTITATGEVTGNGIKLSSHTHSGVESGSSSTGGPQ